MKKILLAATLALAAFLPSHADAQTVFRQPTFIAANNWADFGNGPTELLAVEGSAIGYTSMSSATASLAASGGAVLTLPLNLNPAPLVGAIASGVGVVPGSTVVSYVPGTGVLTISANLTVTGTGTIYSFGVACQANGTTPLAPTAIGSGLGAPLNLRAAAGSTGSGLATPMYTQGRICVYGGQQQGGTVVNFPIGAW